MNLEHTLLVASLALIMERIAGYPIWLYRWIGHPVEWIGKIIAELETILNKPGDGPGKQVFYGLFAITLMAVLLTAICTLLMLPLRQLPWPAFFEALPAVPLLAQSQLQSFVRRVADGLEESLDAGRNAVGHVVGRDTQGLTEAQVSRAAIESLAENTSDGVVAPALFLAIFGLPGIVAYKIINTADSMIGYKSPRYFYFGRAAARIDDALNYIPARVTGLLFASATSLTRPSHAADALEAMWHDAPKHASPNAGWPEAAVAGALGIRLGGPREYDGFVNDLPWLGSGRADLDETDIRRALRLYVKATTLFTVLMIINWMFW